MVNKLFYAVCATIIAVLQTGCVRGDKLLFISDSYWWKAYMNDDVIERFKHAGSDHGIDVELRLIGGREEGKEYSTIVSESTASFIGVTPLLAQEVVASARAFDSRRFIVLFSDNLSAQQNIQRLVSDRSEAFRRAGKLVGAIVMGSEGDTSRAVAIFGTDSRDGVRNLESFRRGFDEQLVTDTGERLVVHRISAEEGTAEIRRILARERNQEPEVLVLAAGSGNSAALEVAIPQFRAGIITEGPVRIDEIADRTIATIEEDWISGMITAIESTNPRVVIPAALKRGNAAPNEVWENIKQQ